MSNRQVEKYSIFELTFHGQEPVYSYIKVNCSAVFTNGDKKVELKGFYNGQGEYIVRFMPDELGIWTYEVLSSYFDAVEGQFLCVENKGDNHGPVITKGMFFEYADGTRYIPIGTTCYAWTHQSEALIEQTKKTLAQSPFNKIRMGVFPKSLVYNNNDPEHYPFTRKEDGSWDVHRPDFTFWMDLERHIKDLLGMGIEVDLILFHPYDRWGFSKFTLEEDLAYLDYCIRRLSAFRNIWWSLANEYDTVFNKPSEDWDTFGEFVSSHDPYKHLISNHNCMHLYDFKKPWITHCSIQSPYVHRTLEWRNEFQKPVIVDECGYEGNIEEPWGHLSPFEMVHRFWAVTSKGGFCSHGETYYRDDEVLWWAKGGELRGESVERIAFLKEVLYSLNGEIQPQESKILMDPNDLESTDDQEIQNNPALKAWFAKFTALDWENYKLHNNTYRAKHGDNYQLVYLGKSCQVTCTLELPENIEYNIDLIDVWTMTRETVIARASGKTKVQLPGKEGMAVIATMIQ